ncbi:MAG: hypothetical protein RLZZ416_564, partial [Candidatus Parcubacteria bacterium]
MMLSLRRFRDKTFSSLRIRNYRLYFIGQGLSQIGTWMQTVALGWLVLTLSGSGTKLGVVMALQFLPLLIGAPWGGMMVDRLNKRRILYVTQSCSAALSCTVGVLVFAGSIQMWMLYVAAFAAGLIKVFDNPARQTFISELVGNDQVKNAVSLNSTMVNLARAIGPMLAGILIAGIGIAACFVADALSYLAVLFMLTRLQGQGLGKSHAAHAHSSRLLDGFRYVRSMPLLSSTLVMMAIIGTFAYEFSTSLPILAKQTFLGDASVYASLTSAFGAGSALGGIYAAGRHNVSPRQLVIYAFCFGVSIVATSLAPTLHLMMALLLLVGFFSINVTATANTTIQLESAPHMRGRVMALWNMAIFGSTPVGGPVVGWIGEHIGARWGLVLGGVATIFAAGLAARTLFRTGARPVS